MSESCESDVQMSPMAEKFVIHFGEMGGKWGINRATAQVFAILYLSSRPLHAGEVCDMLGLSRSQMSIALKELVSWRLITMQHLPKDRRAHFVTSEDVWEIARILAEERRRREIEPTRMLLKEAAAMPSKTQDDRLMQEKIRRMSDLLTMLTDWYEDVRKVETRQLVRMLKLGSKVMSLYTKVKGGNKEDK